MIRRAVVACAIVWTAGWMAGCTSPSAHARAPVSPLVEPFREKLRPNHRYRATVEHRGSRWYAISSESDPGRKTEREIEWTKDAEPGVVRTVATFDVIAVFLVHDPTPTPGGYSFYDEVASCRLVGLSP